MQIKRTAKRMKTKEVKERRSSGRKLSKRMRRKVTMGTRRRRVKEKTARLAKEPTNKVPNLRQRRRQLHYCTKAASTSLKCPIKTKISDCWSSSKNHSARSGDENPRLITSRRHCSSSSLQSRGRWK